MVNQMTLSKVSYTYLFFFTKILYKYGRLNKYIISDFKPFDLETWWGKRLYNNITKSL